MQRVVCWQGAGHCPPLGRYRDSAGRSRMGGEAVHVQRDHCRLLGVDSQRDGCVPTIASGSPEINLSGVSPRVGRHVEAELLSATANHRCIVARGARLHPIGRFSHRERWYAGGGRVQVLCRSEPARGCRDCEWT